MPNIAPNNLPVEGKSLLDNFPNSPENEDRLVPPPSSGGSPTPKIMPAPKPPVASSVEPPVANRVEPPKAPSSIKEPVDDIFSDVKEPPVAAKIFHPSSPAEKMAKNTVVETPRQGFKKILITAVVILVFAGVLAGGGYWAYTNFLQPKALNPNLNLNINMGLNVAPAPEANQPAAESVAESVIIDSDNDGLLDSEEQSLGTASLNPDSDGDRLFDGEEVNIYKTDPLNKDTDGDGFDDGSEVQNGYDPKGPGKLIRIPAGQ